MSHHPRPEAPPWQGYEFLASGEGQRLERWGDLTILRPESAAQSPWASPEKLPSWEGRYTGDRATGGRWEWRRPLPDPCVVTRGSLSFTVHPTTSKHLGLFPEQAENWDWIAELISGAVRHGKSPSALNLFGYTGGATLAAAAAGASVCHVDAVRSVVSWCSANARLSGLGNAPIRYIVEDALTFLRREIRRGKRYDVIVMDPPAFGRGKGGELWKLADQLPLLLETAQEALSASPLFLLLNTYSEHAGDLGEEEISGILTRRGGSCETVEPTLTGSLDGRRLTCGLSHRWRP